MTLQATPAVPKPDIASPGPRRGTDIESEMTTLDGFITALSIVRRSDGLVRMPTDAESWEAWAHEFHGLTTIIDATVEQARKLSCAIHGEKPSPATDGEDA